MAFLLLQNVHTNPLAPTASAVGVMHSRNGICEQSTLERVFFCGFVGQAYCVTVFILSLHIPLNPYE